MPPSTFKTKPKRTADLAKSEALIRLRERWEEDNEGEEWLPNKEPIITPLLKAVEGGIKHILTALRMHDDDDAREFMEVYDSCTKTDLKLLTLENIAFASGIGSLRLLEIAQTALYLYGDRQTQMILSASMPSVMRATVKAATDQVPIVAYDPKLECLKQIGSTNGDTKAMEMLLKARGVLPLPKGAQIAIQNNFGDKSEDEKKTLEATPLWKTAEERLRDITATIEPKLLKEINNENPMKFDKHHSLTFDHAGR